MEVSTGELHEELTLGLVGREARSSKKESWAAKEPWQRLQQTPRGTLRWEGLQSCPVVHGVSLLPYGPIPGGSDG